MTLPGEPDPDAVTAAVLACPDVVALTSSEAGGLATYLPGRRIHGVRITTESVEVSVVGRWGPTMAELGTQVVEAVAPHALGRPVKVHVSDLRLPGEDQDDDDAGSMPAGTDSAHRADA